MITTNELRAELVHEARAILTPDDERKMREWWDKHLDELLRETLLA